MASKYVSLDKQNRITGTRIKVFDAKHEESEYDFGEQHRWALVCETHGTVSAQDNRSTAGNMARKPQDWCPSCEEMVEKGERLPIGRQPAADGEGSESEPAGEGLEEVEEVEEV